MEMKRLTRARKILTVDNVVPAISDVIATALSDLIRRRDPLKRAARIAKKTQAAPTFHALSPGESPAV